MRDLTFRLATDPSGVAAGCGDLAVDGLRELQHYGRSVLTWLRDAQEAEDVHRGGGGLDQGSTGRPHVVHPCRLGGQIGGVAVVRRGGQRDDRVHDRAGATQAADLERVVREQADRSDAEGGEDGGRVAVLAGVGGQPEAVVGVDGVRPEVLGEVRPQLVQQADASTLVTRGVDEHATLLSSDQAQAVSQLDAAIAPQ